jgi:hypothetical protein
VKTTPRIPPKNGATFLPGNTIRFELPAQGYINTANTTISFDVNLTGYSSTTTASNSGAAWLQNNVQSAFDRVRLLYGATPLEDMINYNQIVRNLTEWTSSANGTFDQTSIAEGISRVASTSIDTVSFNTLARPVLIQGIFNGAGSQVITPYKSATDTCSRRYQVQLALGLLTQGKLLPSKFMASQLAIEITLASAESTIMAFTNYNVSGGTAATGVAPTYTITNLNLIPEILEFDSSYDAMFLKGLQEGGVPIKFNTWHTFTFNQGGGSIGNYQIQERSRSIKSIFTVVRRSAKTVANDSGATFYGLEAGYGLNYYQYRIGGRYFPAAPVICSNYQSGGDGRSNGATEAFIELQKALNTMGDYRLSTAVNAITWGAPYIAGTLSTTLQESDGTNTYAGGTSGYNATAVQCLNRSGSVAGNGCFAMAINLETSNGAEISGLNAEEQSDISLMCQWGSTGPSAGTFTVESYVLFDSMIVLRPNNVMELIQ